MSLGLQVKALLQLSSVVVDLVEIQNSSVALCLEDGWDFTAQVCFSMTFPLFSLGRFHKGLS